jgi:hypothetical protein
VKKANVEQPTFPAYLTGEELRKRDDYEWALHHPDIQRKYGGKIVVVYYKTVLGAGKTYQTAWAAARRRRDCPQKHLVAMAVVPHAPADDAGAE